MLASRSSLAPASEHVYMVPMYICLCISAKPKATQYRRTFKQHLGGRRFVNEDDLKEEVGVKKVYFSIKNVLKLKEMM